MWVTSGVDGASMAAGDYGIVSVKDGTAKSLVYFEDTEDIGTYDSANETTHTASYTINQQFKIAVAWDGTDIDIGADTGSNMSMTDGTFDGAFDTTGSLISFAESIYGPLSIKRIYFYKQKYESAWIDAHTPGYNQ
jgi:hypothetical protein